MRIGILGGTFDPIHKGHLALARAACDELKLDRVLFIPTCQHPLKEAHEVSTSPEVRTEMVKRGIQGESQFEVSDCEIKRGGVSYTVDTLKELRQQYPEPSELFFITGGDWGRSLDQWKDIDTIFSLAHFVVASRPGFDLGRLPNGVESLEFIPLNISSTDIRQQIQQGQSASNDLPQAVLQLIEERQLYRS